MTKITLDAFGGALSRQLLVSESASRNVDPDNLCLVSAAAQRLSLEERTAAGGERTAAVAGESPLTLAVKAGLTHNVRMLLEHGASPHNANGRNETPLLLGKDGGRAEPESARETSGVNVVALLSVAAAFSPGSGEGGLLRDDAHADQLRRLGGAGLLEELDGHARGRQTG